MDPLGLLPGGPLRLPCVAMLSLGQRLGVSSAGDDGSDDIGISEMGNLSESSVMEIRWFESIAVTDAARRDRGR